MINWEYVPVCIFWALAVIVGFAFVCMLVFAICLILAWIFEE